ncbi:hypothetical protein QWY28_17240 [Nocardioides sp. SOB77]|uniref:Uncharacterized protein n=1 Tax=Nocardioides oceani TaxID=3058369 RepID=A0ABT8FJ51_9ACTN|nr:hypothetical protein [Nocardioides oceani]MDN4174709.1 hypothetical protein [Nocardioides oceani]
MPRHPKRRRSRYPLCNQCRHPIVWFSLHGSWRSFDPKPVDGRRHVGGAAYPVEQRRAWRTRDLVVELMGRRSVSEPEAQDEVYDLPWHVLHACPPDRATREASAAGR